MFSWGTRADCLGKESSQAQVCCCGFQPMCRTSVIGVPALQPAGARGCWQPPGLQGTAAACGATASASSAPWSLWKPVHPSKTKASAFVVTLENKPRPVMCGSEHKTVVLILTRRAEPKGAFGRLSLLSGGQPAPTGGRPGPRRAQQTLPGKEGLHRFLFNSEKQMNCKSI